ncbi:10057_t:CDS:2, partial [Acaulospora morrowiae]
MSTFNGAHKYFGRTPTKWNIHEFLEELQEKALQRKIEVYLLSLETMADNLKTEKGPRYDMARLLLDKLRVELQNKCWGTDKLKWVKSNESESASKPSVNLYNPTITGSTINSLINSGTVDNSKRKKNNQSVGSTVSKKAKTIGEDLEDDDLLNNNRAEGFTHSKATPSLGSQSLEMPIGATSGCDIPRTLPHQICSTPKNQELLKRLKQEKQRVKST